jgi:antirestriction protein ArdC
MFDGYQYVTDKIIEGLERGIIPWHMPWKTKGPNRPVNYYTKEPYTGINIMTLFVDMMLFGWSTNYWIGFNQAKKLGGHVKKGEKSTLVLLAKTVYDDDGEFKYFYFNYLRVFNLDQIEGIELPEIEMNEFTPDPIPEQLLARMKNLPPILFEGEQACYIPNKDEIHMPAKNSFTCEDGYYATLFHEIVHSTSHTKRLARDTSAYSREELVAELGAAMLCSEANILNNTIENTQAYINSWIRNFKDKPKMVVQCSSKAHKAVEYLINYKEEKIAV